MDFGGGSGYNQYQKKSVRLPPEVSKILYIRNLPFNIKAEDLYNIFETYGAIRQIRRGNKADTRGTAFVVYHDIFDAKNAVDHLSGFNVAGRYLVVLYYNPVKAAKRRDQDKANEDNAKLRQKWMSSAK
eukprot:GHVU01192725.1.p4 GENE.GHVU01192725.1~~GHVU01192725.1.p4  ORF type:complete len:129 (-),score=23.46 GHVU01192725.1:1384-1770(-)